VKCPRCGLINPDIAQRCDCGYDFDKGTIEKAYFKQELPKSIKTYFIFVILFNVAVVIVAISSGELSIILEAIFWTSLIYILYSQLIKKKNWARILLAIITLPVGLALLLSREAKLYCLQK
jgi:hypothetical protein